MLSDLPPPKDYYKGGCRPHLMRLVVDPSAPPSPSGSPPAVEARKLLGNRTVEFPSVSPAVTGRRHQHLYCTADTVGDDHLWGPAQALMKLTLPDDESGYSGGSVMESGEEGTWGGKVGPSGLNNILPGVDRVRSASTLEPSGAAAPHMAHGENGEASGRRHPLVQVWEPGPRSFCGEPMLVPKPRASMGAPCCEDDAWIIVGVHNAETLRADILIFDAAR